MSLTKLIEILEQSSKHSDEELILTTHAAVWDLHLVHGQLLYAADQFHPVRRWDRALKRHCPNWDWRAESFQILDHHTWQLCLLEQGISQERLSLVRAKLIIRNLVQECLFELICCGDLKLNRKPYSAAILTKCRGVALSFWEMSSLQNRVNILWQQWQSANLNALSPTLSPILKESKSANTSQTLPISEIYLNGQFTLWDIAWELEQSVVEVAQALIPLAQQKQLEFQAVPDLPLPWVKQPAQATRTLLEPKFGTEQPIQPIEAIQTLPEPILPEPAVPPTNQQPLIACIDDSPVLAHSLKKILVPAGYQMLSIQEPMRGFTQLIEHKPDLILLDLLLPNADGYSICKFLRDTPVFEKVPIIILTGQNSSIDRMRAKLAGATEFLTKPPHPDELLQLVQKHIPTFSARLKA
jgi:two-component system, chemotaxis family, response regulator PixG